MRAMKRCARFAQAISSTRPTERPSEQKRWADFLDEPTREANDVGSNDAVGVRVGLLELASEVDDLGLSLLFRDSGFQARNEFEPVKLSPVLEVGLDER